MNDATTEQVLVERCKAGDHAAFTELIHQSSPMARRAIRSIAVNPADVEDVMQDTVMNAFTGLRSFDQRCRFSTWFTRIAINNALMLLRRRKNRIEISFDAEADENQNGFLPLPANTISAEQALIREQSIDSLRKAVRSLPLVLREYVELRCFEDLPHKEVASCLGISTSAGKSRALRAQQRLRSSLASLRSRPPVQVSSAMSLQEM